MVSIHLHNAHVWNALHVTALGASARGVCGTLLLQSAMRYVSYMTERRGWRAAVAALMLTTASLAQAGEAQEKPSQSAMCLMLDSAATANDLPVEFLTRVIWRESRIDPQAIGPLTRHGTRA